MTERKLPTKEGEVAENIYFDGVSFFVTCSECMHEQGDMGHGVQCEVCGWGPLPTAESLGYDI